MMKVKSLSMKVCISGIDSEQLCVNRYILSNHSIRSWNVSHVQLHTSGYQIQTQYDHCGLIVSPGQDPSKDPSLMFMF